LSLVFENEKVEITLSGKEQFLSLHKSIVIPFENIVSVEVSSDKKPTIWSKVYGTGVGHYRYGYFNENGKRYFIAT
ncbi:hypothetical protein V7056_16125, partial [Bacillus sp. JJ664]